MAEMHVDTRAVWAFTEHEHQGLTRGLNHIHDVACEIGAWVAPESAIGIREVLDWVDRDLEPHLAWEETWLYPQIDERSGTPWATRSARFDHRQIRDKAARLRADQLLLNEDGVRELLVELRCHLFGLEALLRAHIEREERFLIPLLADDAWVASPAVASGAAGPR